MFWSRSFLSRTHWHSSREAVDTWRTWDLVVCWPYIAYYWRADAKRWQQLVHCLLKMVTIMTQRSKSSEFISTGSKLFLDIRPDYYFPSLEGKRFGYKGFFGLWIFNWDFTLQPINDKQTVLCEPSLYLSSGIKFKDQWLTSKLVEGSLFLYMAISSVLSSKWTQKNEQTEYFCLWTFMTLSLHAEAIWS